MPLYDLTCTACGKVREDVISHERWPVGTIVCPPEPCECGCPRFERKAQEQTADMAVNWGEKCRGGSAGNRYLTDKPRTKGGREIMRGK